MIEEKESAAATGVGDERSRPLCLLAKLIVRLLATGAAEITEKPTASTSATVLRGRVAPFAALAAFAAFAFAAAPDPEDVRVHASQEVPPVELWSVGGQCGGCGADRSLVGPQRRQRRPRRGTQRRAPDKRTPALPTAERRSRSRRIRRRRRRGRRGQTTAFPSTTEAAAAEEPLAGRGAGPALRSGGVGAVAGQPRRRVAVPAAAALEDTGAARPVQYGLGKPQEHQRES